MAKFILTTCPRDENCTVRYSFTDAGDPTIDAERDRIPIPERIRVMAAKDFPGAVCTSEDHHAGVLEVRRAEP